MSNSDSDAELGLKQLLFGRRGGIYIIETGKSGKKYRRYITKKRGREEEPVYVDEFESDESEQSTTPWNYPLDTTPAVSPPQPIPPAVFPSQPTTQKISKSTQTTSDDEKKCVDDEEMKEPVMKKQRLINDMARVDILSNEFIPSSEPTPQWTLDLPAPTPSVKNEKRGWFGRILNLFA